MNPKLLSAAALALAALALSPNTEAADGAACRDSAPATQDAPARHRALTRGHVNRRAGKQLRESEDGQAQDDRRRKKAKKKAGKKKGKKKKKARRRGGTPPQDTPNVD